MLLLLSHVTSDVIEPFLEQRFEFAHILETQVEGFKARDCCLREVIAVQFTHCHANIALCEPYNNNNINIIIIIISKFICCHLGYQQSNHCKRASCQTQC